ncbi:tyrosine-type recombinase/integrase [Actinokineospora fastidiosa]|uniref:Site-specific integrase n=1 Tax=Actinokineospora fastidiosa TaxID=1816 RepID=A0A918GMT3_9PSEU|nr:site-specific integrase [Actinokineospora fastidiosa]GGS43981.1 site-specific integrase [Actinokineospora fastidiosa]
MAGKARGNGEGSIYPHRNGYAAYVWVTTPTGKRTRKYVYGTNRDIVHAKWLKLHQAAAAGPVATTVPKLGEYLLEWLAEVIKPNRAPLTYVNYELFVRLYIEPGLGNTRLDKLQRSQVQKWINSLPTLCQCCKQGKDARRPPQRQRCCAKGRCCGQSPSARTVKDIRDCLRNALNHATKDELISRNVAALVTLPAVRRPMRKAWTSEEARAFLESAKVDRDPLYAAYLLILVMGLRKGEALGLTWESVDLDQGELLVAQQLQRAQRELLHRDVKTDASEDGLPLVEPCLSGLRERQQEQETAKSGAGPAWQNAAGLVFTTLLGTPIEPRNFNRAWDARVRKAGVRKITVHDGRRTCGTLLVDLDVHPRLVRRILRHAQFSVTIEIYAQASSKKTRDALKRLGGSLG